MAGVALGATVHLVLAVIDQILRTPRFDPPVDDVIRPLAQLLEVAVVAAAVVLAVRRPLSGASSGVVMLGLVILGLSLPDPFRSGLGSLHDLWLLAEHGGQSTAARVGALAVLAAALAVGRSRRPGGPHEIEPSPAGDAA